MTKWSQERKDIMIEILGRTLGDLSDWVPVKLRPGVGPQYPQVHFEFGTKLQAYRDRVSSMLARKSIEELRSEYLMTAQTAHNPLTQPNGVHYELCEELDHLKRTRPPWFGSGWSEKNHLIDVDYWAAAEIVALNEAALLLVGVDPRKANYDALFHGYGTDERTDEVLYFLEDCFELIVRRFGDPEDGPLNINLQEYCRWVHETDLGVSPELAEISKRRKIGDPDKPSRRAKNPQTKSLHGHSRAMFQRVLLVVAIDRYGLRGKKDATKAAKAIVNAGDFKGFTLDEQNIAKHIRAGFDQLDEDEKVRMRGNYDEK